MHMTPRLQKALMGRLADAAGNLSQEGGHPQQGCVLEITHMRHICAHSVAFHFDKAVACTCIIK